MLSERVREIFDRPCYRVLSSTFQGVSGEQVPWVEVWCSSLEKYQVICSAIGERLFLDDRIEIDSVKQQEVIFLHKFASTLGNLFLGPYAASTIVALESVDVKGCVGLDLGCADGVQGLVALKNGAQKMFGVERDLKQQTLLRKHMSANSLPEESYEFVCADINDGVKDKLPLKEISFVIANIGPHYNGTDIIAVKLLDSLPNCSVFVGGGYSVSDKQHKKSPFSAQKVRNMFCDRGFTNWSTVRESNADHYYRLAFVARRS